MPTTKNIRCLNVWKLFIGIPFPAAVAILKLWRQSSRVIQISSHRRAICKKNAKHVFKQETNIQTCQSLHIHVSIIHSLHQYEEFHT